jgi:hypothetical protein
VLAAASFQKCLFVWACIWGGVYSWSILGETILSIPVHVGLGGWEEAVLAASIAAVQDLAEGAAHRLEDL